MLVWVDARRTFLFENFDEMTPNSSLLKRNFDVSMGPFIFVHMERMCVYARKDLHKYITTFTLFGYSMPRS